MLSCSASGAKGQHRARRVLAPETGDPLAAPHIYLDEFQPDTDVSVFTDYREMIAADAVDAGQRFHDSVDAPPGRRGCL